MRIRLVVEGTDFAIAATLVERLSLGKRLVRLQTKQRKPPFPRKSLETIQDALPDAEPAGGRRDPHALDLAIGRMALQGAAPDRLVIQCGQDEEPVRRCELPRSRRYAERGIETGLEPRGQFLEIAPQAIPGSEAPGILHVQTDCAGQEETLDGLHGRNEGASLRLVELVEE